MNDSNCSWFAVYTRPRQEHVALLNLERQAFTCYLPMVGDAHRRRGAADKGRQEPLFPRYLFMSAVPEQQSLAVVRSTRGVVGMVRAGSELVRISASTIQALKARMDPATGLIALAAKTLHDGDKVRVFDGPFGALEGVFKEHRGRTRSLLLLEILGRETAVELEANLLQRIG